MDEQRCARVRAIGVSVMGTANDRVTHQKHLGGQPAVHYREFWDKPSACRGVGRSLMSLALLCLSAQTFLAGKYCPAVEASSSYPSSTYMSARQQKRQTTIPQMERGMLFSSPKFVARIILSLSGGAAGGDADVGNSDIEMFDGNDSSSESTSGTESIRRIEKADISENSNDCASCETNEQVINEHNDDPTHKQTSTKIEMAEKLSEETAGESITNKQIDPLSDVIRSDVIRNIILARSASSATVESMELRKLMSARREEYIQTLLEYTGSDNGDSLPQHPKKLLHFLAPKIPAIKHSPNYNLRIRSASADVDSGLAACAIFTLASVTEIYDKRAVLNDCGDREGRVGAKEIHEGASDEQVSSASVVVSDRRFEQLVECVLCGVNVKKRLKEAKALDRAAASAATTSHKEKSDGIGNGSTSLNATEETGTKEGTDETHAISAHSDEMEEKNDLSTVEESVERSGEEKVEKLYKHEGISLSDACRVAWGLAVLGAHHLPKIGGERPKDILLALSLRTRDLLLARFHRLQHGGETVDSGDVNFDPDGIDPRQSFEDEVAELTEDTAAAMWTFACVKACTGIQSDYLFNVCCSILSIRKDSLVALRERGQEDVEMDDIVDKLVRSEKESIVSSVKAGGLKTLETSQSTGEGVAPGNSDSSTHLPHQRHLVLLDSLSSKDLVNVVWALAMHGCVEGTVRSEVSSLTDKVVALRGVASRRILELLHGNVIGAIAQAGTTDHEQGSGGTEHNYKDPEGSPSPIKPNGSTSSDIDVSDGVSRGAAKNPEVHQLVGSVEILDPVASSQSNAERPAGSQQPNDNELDPVAASQSNAERPAGSQQRNEIEQVEVVDAASLLGSGDVNVETETLIAPATGSTEDHAADARESSEVISSLEGDKLEVIDAASLLDDTGLTIPVSSEELKPRPGIRTEHSIQERKNVSTEYPHRDLGHNELADADSILSAETDAHFVNTQVMSEDVPVDEPANVLLTSDDDRSFVHAKESSTDGETVGQTDIPGMNTFALDANQSFSTHDLCLVAWAFTELRDPHRTEIIELVQQLLLNTDFLSLASLEPRDLSNLAWALARYAETSKLKPSAYSCAYMLTQQIAELAQAKSQNFEPTELSRLMWSLATVASRPRHSSHNAENDRGTNSLVEFALETAGADCNAVSGRVFSTEDLARIAWAFLEICDKTVHSSFPLKTSKVLGRIQSTIEASLLRWESGQYSQPSKPVCESTRLTPLFGKSRSLISILDLKIGDIFDDGQVDINDSTAVHSGDDSNLPAKSHLPALRDLPVDPATLCKLVYGYSRLHPDHADINGACILLRVATRLLSSKNGQLLKECKPQDIVRLCYACATLIAVRGCDISSEDRDIVLRQFPRRVVELINQSSHEAGASFLDLLGTPDLTALLWSLGELGVQTGTERDDNRFAHRKMHLTAKKPLLSPDELKDLPANSLIQLFCGVVALGVMEDVPLLNKILLQFQSKAVSLSPHECCQIARALAKIRRRIGLHFVRTDPNYELKEVNSNGGDKVGDSETAQRPVSKSEDEDKLVSALEENEAAAEIVIENLSHEGVSNELLNGLLISCNHMLSVVANFASTNISDFSAVEIRKLLEIYAIIPFDSDMLVDSIEIEVNKRCASLEVAAAMPDSASVQMLIRRAADSAVEAATCIPRLTRDDEKDLNPLKNGIKALFEKKSSVEVDDKDPGSELASTLINASEMINRAAASACEAAARIERVDRGALVNSESILRGSEEEASFELGRCQALIANYRQMK